MPVAKSSGAWFQLFSRFMFYKMITQIPIPNASLMVYLTALYVHNSLWNSFNAYCDQLDAWATFVLTVFCLNFKFAKISLTLHGTVIFKRSAWWRDLLQYPFIWKFGMPLYTISMFCVLKLLDIYVQSVPFIMFVSMVAVMGYPDRYRLCLQ